MLYPALRPLLVPLRTEHPLLPSPYCTPSAQRGATIPSDDLATQALGTPPIRFTTYPFCPSVSKPIVHPRSSPLRCKGVRQYSTAPQACKAALLAYLQDHSFKLYLQDHSFKLSGYKITI